MQVVNALFSYTVPQRPGLQNIAASASKVLHQDSTILSTFIFFRAGRLQGCGGATWQQCIEELSSPGKKMKKAQSQLIPQSQNVKFCRDIKKYAEAKTHHLFLLEVVPNYIYVYTSYTKSIICTVEQFQFSYICQIIRNPNHLVLKEHLL